MKDATRAISFKKDSTQKSIDEWDQKNNGKLSKLLRSGQMVKVENWLFVNVKILREQKKKLEILYSLLEFHGLQHENEYDQLKDSVEQKIKHLKHLQGQFLLTDEDSIYINGLHSIVPAIVRQPLFLIKALIDYPSELPENKWIYYRYAYLDRNLNQGPDKFYESSLELSSTVRLEIAKGEKRFSINLFLFIEQLIDELGFFNAFKYNYFKSPIFNLLFFEIIKFKEYYIDKFGRFRYTNILDIEKKYPPTRSMIQHIFPPSAVISNKLKINGSIDNLRKDMIELLTRINPKNNKVYMEESDILNFINQNFAASLDPIISENKTIKPNMNKTELRQVMWIIYKKYHLSSQKHLWHKMFNDNFPSFHTADISNIKDYSLKYLKL